MYSVYMRVNEEEGGWGGCGLRNAISAVNTHLNGEEEGVFIINR